MESEFSRREILKFFGLAAAGMFLPSCDQPPLPQEKPKICKLNRYHGVRANWGESIRHPDFINSAAGNPSIFEYPAITPTIQVNTIQGPHFISGGWAGRAIEKEYWRHPHLSDSNPISRIAKKQENNCIPPAALSVYYTNRQGQPFPGCFSIIYEIPPKPPKKARKLANSGVAKGVIIETEGRGIRHADAWPINNPLSAPIVWSQA
ncbi:hypothetical protein ACFL0Y_03590, partial [Patescibacteria group bacterium]